MTVSATDVVAPVLAASEVVVFLFAGMATQARFGDLFRGLVLEGDDLFRIAFLSVSLAWTVTGLATRHFLFPTTEARELGMGSVREGFELIFVAVFTGFTADIIVRLVCLALSRVGRAIGT